MGLKEKCHGWGAQAPATRSNVPFVNAYIVYVCSYMSTSYCVYACICVYIYIYSVYKYIYTVYIYISLSLSLSLPVCVCASACLCVTPSILGGWGWSPLLSSGSCKQVYQMGNAPSRERVGMRLAPKNFLEKSPLPQLNHVLSEPHEILPPRNTSTK